MALGDIVLRHVAGPDGRGGRGSALAFGAQDHAGVTSCSASIRPGSRGDSACVGGTPVARLSGTETTGSSLKGVLPSGFRAQCQTGSTQKLRLSCPWVAVDSRAPLASYLPARSRGSGRRRGVIHSIPSRQPLTDGHLDLDEEIRAREPGDATPQGRGGAPGEPGRPLTVGAIHLGAIDGEDAPSDDVVKRGAGLLQRPANRFVRVIRLRGPVPRRLRLAGRAHRRAAADLRSSPRPVPPARSPAASRAAAPCRCRDELDALMIASASISTSISGRMSAGILEERGGRPGRAPRARPACRRRRRPRRSDRSA